MQCELDDDNEYFDSLSAMWFPHEFLLIAWTIPAGLVLCIACQWFYHLPEGGQADAGSHSASNLTLTLKSHPAWIPDGPVWWQVKGNRRAKVKLFFDPKPRSPRRSPVGRKHDCIIIRSFFCRLENHIWRRWEVHRYTILPLGKHYLIIPLHKLNLTM